MVENNFNNSLENGRAKKKLRDFDNSLVMPYLTAFTRESARLNLDQDLNPQVISIQTVCDTTTMRAPFQVHRFRVLGCKQWGHRSLFDIQHTCNA